MQDFLRHITANNQQFKCYLNTDKSHTLVLTVTIHNELNAGATGEAITMLSKLVPLHNEQMVAFYQRHDGVKLYCNGATAGLQFYPVTHWDKLNAEWKAGHSDLQEDELYDFQKGGVAFGEISQSGNYFILYEGKVYYDDHDGGDDTVVGETFYKFLSKIVANPAEFLYDMGCYTRYSDGRTYGQYIPAIFTSAEN